MGQQQRIVVAALLAAAACTGAADTTDSVVSMPEPLVGRWTSAHPDYADRYFELSATTLLLGTGAQTSEQYWVSRVLQDREDRDLYTVEYTDSAGAEYSMSFYFYPAREDPVRLRNQPHVGWRKEADG